MFQTILNVYDKIFVAQTFWHDTNIIKWPVEQMTASYESAGMCLSQTENRQKNAVPLHHNAHSNLDCRFLFLLNL